MDNSKEFNLMLDEALTSEPLRFKDFDRTKNVQDQLQAMVGDYGHFERFTNTLIGFIEWYKSELVLYPKRRNYEGMETKYSSMEQLWLAFCMSERYQKIWSGTDWVKRV